MEDMAWVLYALLGTQVILLFLIRLAARLRFRERPTGVVIGGLQRQGRHGHL